MEPLKPNHLSLLKTKPFLPGMFSPSDCYGRRRWRQVQYMADLFWKQLINSTYPKNGPRKKGILSQETLSSSSMTLVQEIHGLWDKSLKSYQVQEVLCGKCKFVRKTSTLCRPTAELVLLVEAQNGLLTAHSLLPPIPLSLHTHTTTLMDCLLMSYSTFIQQESENLKMDVDVGLIVSLIWIIVKKQPFIVYWLR